MRDIFTALEADFIEEGKARLLSQFQHAPNLNALLALLLSPYHDLQQTLIQLLNERHIDTAMGKQLDGVGDIVGISRPFIQMNGEWYFGFRGQSKAKAFSRAPIRDLALQSTSREVRYMDNNNYRRLIKWKVIANNSHGTIDDVIAACQAVFLASQVIIQELADAAVKIVIVRAAKSKLDAIEQDPTSWIPTAAGVKVTVEFRNQ